MISLSTAESALKEAYLNAVCNQLNTNANPLLAKIKQSSADVYGKNIIKMAPIGLNGGVGAGAETGELPTARSNRYAQFKTTLKNLYGQIEISDKAIRASASSAGAFVDLLNAEMEGLLTASKFNLGRMLYGDGSGALGTVTSTPSGKVIAFDSVKNFAEGMCIDFGADTQILRVMSVDRANKTITVDTTVTGVEVGAVAYVQGSKDYEITGLGAIFGNTETLYGLNRAENGWLKPYTSTTETEISDDLLQAAVDYLNENSASEIDIITCGSGVRRAYMQYLSCYRRNIDVMNLAGGYKAISFNGIP
ncbi:MAG: phage major capsid protein, partial [Clostridia bacterium]|nr:phage major capsid protein [Clostridia bacterium]